MSNFSLSGNIVDIFNRKIYPGTIKVTNGIIYSIREVKDNLSGHFIIPGFIDSHIHIESSMLPPSEFARLAVIHGTVATVSDPHEIANVMGIEGIIYMLRNAQTVSFKFNFGAPSCVPATLFETSGANISVQEIKGLLSLYEFKYLSEMMNFPGVINESTDVMQKIEIAKNFGKPIDGHSPGLKGMELYKYINAGINTDHECTNIEEGLEKINLGMKILIRDGSAAKDFESLHPLIAQYPAMCMFCSDDKHPDDLKISHINSMVKRAVGLGYDLFDVLRCASLNPVMHYKLDVGLLREGDDADFIVIDNLSDFNIIKTYIRGEVAADNGKCLITFKSAEQLNNFNTKEKKSEEFKVLRTGKYLNIIDIVEGELLTERSVYELSDDSEYIESDIVNDILKLTVVNRYSNAKPSIGFVRNFGLKTGALASSVSHDSHNIIAIGTNDEDLCLAINGIIKNYGGLAIAANGRLEVLPLPIAGLMSIDDGFKFADKYGTIQRNAIELGTGLKAPFMTLSFLALLVIPKLKLSDKGLFDSEKFEFIELQF